MSAYEQEWDAYSKRWNETAKGTNWKHLGDEWGDGHFERYERFMRPHIDGDSMVLEIGPGGGRLTELMLPDCRGGLACLDVSETMLKRLAERIGEHENLLFIKGDGQSLAPLHSGTVGTVISYDVFVHLEPEDIFAYLIEIKRVLKPGGCGMLHFHNMLTDAGFAKFEGSYRQWLGGKRGLGKFSAMSVPVMEKFLSRLGFELVMMDTENFVGGRDAFAVFKKP